MEKPSYCSLSRNDLALFCEFTRVYFIPMRTYSIALLLLLAACASPPPKPVPEKPAETPPRSSKPFIPLKAGLLTEYDIWEFLKASPNEKEVLNELGPPDSIWVAEDSTYQVWYYYRPEYQDYNSIEIELPSHRITGFEWD